MPPTIRLAILELGPVCVGWAKEIAAENAMSAIAAIAWISRSRIVSRVVTALFQKVRVNQAVRRDEDPPPPPLNWSYQTARKSSAFVSVLATLFAGSGSPV